MSDKGKGILRRVTLLKPGDKSHDIYDDWAEGYDVDLLEQYGYIAPQISVQAFPEYCTETSVSIIDYGCGTGLVGEELTHQGYANIDGLDLSQKMLREAGKKNLYQNLFKGDLTTTLEIADECYDAMICVGSFGNGHVEPKHLPELIRTVKANGLIVLYMNGDPYVDDDYPAQFAGLEAAGIWKIIKQEQSNYMTTLNRPGWLVVARRESN